MARKFVALAILGLLLVCAGYIAGPERLWIVAQIQYLPALFFLAPALAAFGAAWRLPVRWRLASGASLVLVATCLMGLQVNVGESGTQRLRFMTYNVKGYLAAGKPQGVLPLASEIALHDADVMVLQDAAEIARLAPDARRAFFGEREVRASGQYVIASRYPLKDCATGAIPFRGLPHSYFHCTATIAGREVDIVTAHLITPREGLNAFRDAESSAIAQWKRNVSDRLAQSEGLARDLRARHRAMIVAGDFNAPATSLVVRRLLATGMRDAFGAAGLGFGYSYGHAIWPGPSFLRIDHILVSEEFAVADCFTGGGEASPHRPVIADLYVSRG